MAGAKKESKAEKNEYRIPKEDALWSGLLLKASGLIALVGLVLSAIGFTTDANRFGYSYLFGFTIVATIVLGGIFYCIATHFTAGHWGVTARRFAEVAGGAAPLLVLLFVPIAVGVFSGTFHMYDEWLDVDRAGHGEHEEGAHDDAAHEDAAHEEAAEEHSSFNLLLPNVAHAQDNGGASSAEFAPEYFRRNPPADGLHGERTPQEHEAHHNVLHHKSGWLSGAFWLVRGFAYLFIWAFFGWFFLKKSTDQDKVKNGKERFAINNKIKSYSASMAIAFGLTLTFAAFDWLMALEPSWYSTIYGVTIFAGSAVAILALQTIVGISLYEKGHLGEALNTEHFHDLGKLLYGFMCFWAYVCFSQWMLIWYAGIPEEAVWYHKRWGHGWQFWSLLVGFGHFVLPFYFLMSRIVKRRLTMMKFGAVWLFVMHICDVYWLVLPQAGDFGIHVMDIGAALLCMGIFFAYFFWTLAKHPLIPLGDPRLQRCIHHHQSH